MADLPITSDEYRHRVSTAMSIGGWRFEKTCWQGKAAACTQLGNLGSRYQNGLGVDQDYRLAVEFLQQGCDNGNGDGCGHGGWMYYTGNEIAADKSRGLALLNQACGMGDSWSFNKINELGK